MISIVRSGEKLRKIVDEGNLVELKEVKLSDVDQNVEDINENKVDQNMEDRSENKVNQDVEKKTEHENISVQDVLEFAVEAGRVLLKNGAEIFRVEETIQHICNHYQIKNVNSFVLSNGIFLTGEKEGREVFAKVQYVPLSGTHLGIVDGVNHLSREICAGKVSLEEASIRLAEIAARPPKKSCFRILAAAAGSACFCYLLDATVMDCIRTFMVGIVLNIVLVYFEKHHLSKMLINTVGGALVGIMAVWLCRENGVVVSASLDKVIIGSIFSLVPGVPFVNAMRDIADSDFISGIVKLIDALLRFAYIAIGVGVALSLYSSVIGGPTL